MRKVPPTFCVDTNDWLELSRLLEGGVKGIGRYHSDDEQATMRNLTLLEAQTYREHRLPKWSIWQNAKAAEVLLGYESGVRCATEANRQQMACGEQGQPIYFAVDFIGNSQNIEKVKAFFKGAKSKLGFDRMGAYGTHYTINALFEAGLIKYGWQTAVFQKWTGYEPWHQRAQLRQIYNSYPDHDNFGAITYLCYDHAVAHDFGQWL